MDYYDDYTGDGAITMDDYGDYAPAEPEYPAYLRDAPPTRRTYGILSYNRKSKCWIIRGEPCVTELAKRLFPGCESRGRGVARFTAHRRIIGDLNWLMLRRLKADVLAELAPKRRLVQEIDWDDAVYRELMAPVARQLQMLRATDVPSRRAIIEDAISQTQRQATGIAKAPFMCAFVRA